MTYRLKTIKFQGRDCQILLQNENGPCPLLAAANALLLKGSINLPPYAVRNSVASLDDVTNMLANHAMLSYESLALQKKEAKTEITLPQSQSEEEMKVEIQDSQDSEALPSETSDHFFVNELMHYIPKFQYGMDVNPKFTEGITGYECTAELTAFDMLQCKLVHGWLVDPINDADLCHAIGRRSYNELVDRVITGKESEEELVCVTSELDAFRDAHPELAVVGNTVDFLDDSIPVETKQTQAKYTELKRRQDELQTLATEVHLIDHFLASSSHQLTSYGLEILHEQIKDDELCVFFRNNHFCTLHKHDKSLFLLVTDLGYATTPNIVWEKLDVIDGDTEFCNSKFQTPGAKALEEQRGPTLTPEQMQAASSQNEADYNLALHLSMQDKGGATMSLDAQEGQIVAAATEASLRTYNGVPDTPPGTIPSNLPPGVEVGVPINFSPTEQIQNRAISKSELPDDDRKPPAVVSPVPLSQEASDMMLARQLQDHHVDDMEDPSLALARKLQAEEDSRAAKAASQSTNNAARRQASPARGKINNNRSSGKGNDGENKCVVM